MSNPRNNIVGGLFMMSAMAGFVINDALVKSISISLGLGQILFIRGVIAMAIISLIAWRMGALRPISTIMQPLFLLRVAAELATTVFFLTALFHIPIANATAILQAIPLVVTLGAWLFLSENVGYRRISAIVIGFIGVLLIIRPGYQDFSVFSLYAAAAVFTSAIRDLATRRLDPAIPNLFITVVTATGVSLLGGLMCLFTPLQPVSAPQFFQLTVAAIFLLAGYFFIVAAMRKGDISFVSPFRYSILIWAVLIGLIFFNETPDEVTLIGSALIVGTGIFTFYREQLKN